jgi:hypothetical protein
LQQQPQKGFGLSHVGCIFSIFTSLLLYLKKYGNRNDKWSPSLLAFGDCRWPSLACVGVIGFHGPSLAFMGLCWTLLSGCGCDGRGEVVADGGDETTFFS